MLLLRREFRIAWREGGCRSSNRGPRRLVSKEEKHFDLVPLLYHSLPGKWPPKALLYSRSPNPTSSAVCRTAGALCLRGSAVHCRVFLRICCACLRFCAGRRLSVVIFVPYRPSVAASGSKRPFVTSSGVWCSSVSSFIHDRSSVSSSVSALVSLSLSLSLSSAFIL